MEHSCIYYIFACFVKLSVKSTSAAKLFNAVHKAQVSWKRIRPLMHPQNVEKEQKIWEPGELNVLAFKFRISGWGTSAGGYIISAQKGQIIGITGPVAAVSLHLARHSYVNILMKERYSLPGENYKI